jgi:CRP-like cAMP-binding protein
MHAVDGGDTTEFQESIVDRLLPIASRIRLSDGAALEREGAIYFPLDGVATLILSRDDARCQVGFARRGDAIGLQGLFVPDFPVVVATVLRKGAFVRVTSDVLRRLMRDDPSFRDRLSMYAMHAMGRYLSEAAGALASSLEQRVARWILLCRRALDDDVLPVTHERIAEALGVRRSGVTVALHVLEGQMLIRSRRGRIDVRDRKGLRSFATGGRRAATTTAPMIPALQPQGLREGIELS